MLEVTSASARLLAGLVTALGVAAAGCAGVLLLDGRGPWPSVLVGVAWLLRSRSYAAAATRVSLIVVGLGVLAGLGVRTASEMDADWLVARLSGWPSRVSCVWCTRSGWFGGRTLPSGRGGSMCSSTSC